MTRTQFRELCRFVVADRLKIDAGKVSTRGHGNPRRAGLPFFEHSLDLCWESENKLSRYLHVGRVRWRSRRRIGEEEILVLQQIKDKVGAHKALFFTNTGFSDRAICVAEDGGLGLLVVQPAAGVTGLRARPPELFFRGLCKLAENKPPYTLHVLRDGVPPLLTRTAANLLIEQPAHEAEIRRALAQGRWMHPAMRLCLARLAPSLAEALLQEGPGLALYAMRRKRGNQTKHP